MFISIPFYRTLVQFGLMRDFIRHLQKYPVQLNSEEELPTQMKQLAQYVYYIRYFAIVISENCQVLGEETSLCNCGDLIFTLAHMAHLLAKQTYMATLYVSHTYPTILPPFLLPHS